MNYKNYFKSAMIGCVLSAGLLISTAATADKYEIDLSHSFIEFGTMHLGFSILKGRFNKFSGEVNFNEPSSSDVDSTTIEIDMTSVDSNWAARDKHLRSADFFDVDKYPTAKFVSKEVKVDGDKITIIGDFTLHGTTKSITIDASKIADGKDPWGGFRVGFKGDFSFNRSDFGVSKNLGPKSEKVDINLYIEAVKK